jgi:hypothetical protein
MNEAKPPQPNATIQPNNNTTQVKKKHNAQTKMPVPKRMAQEKKTIINTDSKQSKQASNQGSNQKPVQACMQ